MVGRLPESWIPPEHLLELRARVRLRHTLVDQRREWQQRMQAALYHHGVSAPTTTDRPRSVLCPLALSSRVLPGASLTLTRLSSHSVTGSGEPTRRIAQSSA